MFSQETTILQHLSCLSNHMEEDAPYVLHKYAQTTQEHT